MTDKHDYAEMGMWSLRHAVKKGYEDIMKNNLKIPIWENGRVEYIGPTWESISELITPENWLINLDLHPTFSKTLNKEGP